jgi:hypothetical protein
MYLIFGATSCCIGILLIGLRGVMRQRRLGRQQERLPRAIHEVLFQSGAEPRPLKSRFFLSSPFSGTEDSMKVISHRNRIIKR